MCVLAVGSVACLAAETVAEYGSTRVDVDVERDLGIDIIIAGGPFISTTLSSSPGHGLVYCSSFPVMSSQIQCRFDIMYTSSSLPLLRVLLLSNASLFDSQSCSAVSAIQSRGLSLQCLSKSIFSSPLVLTSLIHISICPASDSPEFPIIVQQ